MKAAISSPATTTTPRAEDVAHLHPGTGVDEVIAGSVHQPLANLRLPQIVADGDLDGLHREEARAAGDVVQP
jgi:hypothetical protein